MSRYIDVDKVIEDMNEVLINEKHKGNENTVAYFAFKRIIEALRQEPTADVEEVMRCKDCKYAKKVRNRNQEDCNYICCCFRDNPDKTDVVDYYRFMVRPDGYCYRGAKIDKE